MVDKNKLYLFLGKISLVKSHETNKKFIFKPRFSFLNSYNNKKIKIQGDRMQNEIKRLLTQAVEKQAKISALYGVPLNQKDKDGHFEQWKNQWLAGEINKESILEYINEPLPSINNLETNQTKTKKHKK